MSIFEKMAAMKCLFPKEPDVGSQNKNTMRKSIPILLSMLFCLGIVMPTLAQSGEEFGMASYYHESFDGNETAYGKTYDKDKFTAAHLQHPLGTKLRVTRLDNKKSVVVTVNDKGPYKRGRIIDLSTAAAKRLNLIEDGVTQVKVEVIDRPKSRKESSDSKTSSTRQGSDERPSSYANTSTRRISAEDERQSAQRKETAEQERSVAPTSSRSSTKKRRPADGDGEKSGEAQYELVGKEYQKYGLYKISLFKPEQEGFAVQVASLTNYENVFKQVADLQAKWFDNVLISIEEGRLAPTYKIMLGPFEKEAAAENYRKNLMKKHNIKGFVVDLSTIEFTRER